MEFEQRFGASLCIKPVEIDEDDREIEPEIKISPDFQACLDAIIEKEGYEKYDTKITAMTTEGGNFLGDLYEVDIKGKTKKGVHDTNIFVKFMPETNLLTATVSISQSYYNERLAYEDIGKIMNELYIEACVPESKRFKMVKFYKESNEHALLFENLNRKGYSTLDRRQVMSLNFATSAIKELAKFHSITFILKAKRIDYFKNNIKTLKSPSFIDRNDKKTTAWWKDFLTNSLNTSFDYINKEFENKKESIKLLYDKHFDMIAIDSTSRLSSINCMCHGDIKTGNILWKKDDQGEIDTVLIDYQMLNYGTPIYDIMYLIYLGTDWKFRKDHLDYLKNLYHDTMTGYLKYFDLDVNSFYPKHVFEKDFQERLYYGLLIGLFYLPFILIEKPDLLVSEGSEPATSLHSSFKERINGVVQEYIERGIL